MPLGIGLNSYPYGMLQEVKPSPQRLAFNPIGSWVQNPEVEVVKLQMHAPEHGTFWLHVPLQAGKSWGELVSCRAEMSPAEHTMAKVMASASFLIMLTPFIYPIKPIRWLKVRASARCSALPPEELC